MKKEKVGLVTGPEKEEIKLLFERKLALNELIPALNSNLLSKEQRDELYEKIIADIGKTTSYFQAWWQEKAKKYNWKHTENGNWHIDFESDEIFLVTN